MHVATYLLSLTTIYEEKAIANNHKEVINRPVLIYLNFMPKGSYNCFNLCCIAVINWL